MMHFRSITNVAWVLRPTRAPEAPIHQLIAVCTAILRPTESIWASFVTKLGDLVADGELDDDESIAVLASELTREKLTDYDQVEDLEADNVREIVERVQQNYESELQHKLEIVRWERDAGEAKAEQAKRRAELIESNLRSQADRLANWISGVACGMVGLAIVAGAAMTLPTDFSQMLHGNSVAVILAWVCLLLYVSYSLLGIITSRLRMLNLFYWLKTQIGAIYSEHFTA